MRMVTGRNICSRARPSSMPSASRARLAQSPCTASAGTVTWYSISLGVFTVEVAVNPSGSRRRERLATSGAEYVVASCVLLPDDQPPRLVEKRRRLRLLDGDAHTHMVVAPLPRRNLQPRPQRFVVPVEIQGHARRQIRPHRLARELQHRFAGFGRSKLHGQNPVFEFDGEQLRRGVHDVFGAGEIGALVAQPVRSERHAQRQPQRFPRRHRHVGNHDGPLRLRLRHPHIVLERLGAVVGQVHRRGRRRNHLERRQAGRAACPPLWAAPPPAATEKFRPSAAAAPRPAAPPPWRSRSRPAPPRPPAATPRRGAHPSG